MLSARLRELADGGVIERDGGGYRLTAAGRELEGVVAALGTWGQRWLPREAGDDDLDALVWDMQRRVAAESCRASPSSSASKPRILRRSRPRFLLLREAKSRCAARTPASPSRSRCAPIAASSSAGGGATSTSPPPAAAASPSTGHRR